MVNEGIERAVLIIGRAAILYPSRDLLRDMVLEDLHQARLTDAGFATEQHHLSSAGFAPLPAFTEQLDFLLSAHQRRQSSCCCRFQATPPLTFTNDSVHLNWRRNTFQEVRAEILTVEQAFDEAISSCADDDCIRLGQSLHTSSNVGGIAQS